ncbi:MAG: RNA-binding S4 domain-containing protein [Clostridiales bacterium]|nr:RNA-binding S4 domain-containing protein [Clostridiales bacterium]
MRLDKFLKVSRVIKRRTVADEACQNGRVSINGKVSKSSTSVNIGDIIEVKFGDKILKFEVLSLTEHVKKEEASDMIKIM